MARLVLMGKRTPLIHLAGSRSSEPGNGQQFADLGPVLEVGVPESLLQIRLFPDDPLLEDEVRHQGCKEKRPGPSEEDQSGDQSRVGKGRPAGSIELRVSPSPSKIPYGGFSPVRLQMDRQWRPSTTARGLSAVHIRPMTPSYTVGVTLVSVQK